MQVNHALSLLLAFVAVNLLLRLSLDDVQTATVSEKHERKDHLPSEQDGSTTTTGDVVRLPN